jgi:DNA-binding NarL/FixJ family response regulator
VIRVAVIAASPAVRAGLRVLLASDESIAVIGDGAALSELTHAPLAAADVAVIHGAPSPGSLPESLRGVLLLLDEGQPIDSAPPLPAAWGALPADASADELIAAVGALYHGLLVIHPHLQARLIRAAAVTDEAIDPLVEALTQRELEVLQQLGQGLTNRQIADRLTISEHTVKFHVSAIYAKLGVASRTEAVRAGARRGLIVL